MRCEKDLKDNKDNSLHLGRKYARIFVLGHYLFLVAHSFPRASLSENCSLLGTDNVRGQISEDIFAPNGDYCLYSARPPKIPGWIVVVHESFSVNKRVSEKINNGNCIKGVLSVFFFKFYIWLSRLKKLKLIQLIFELVALSYSFLGKMKRIYRPMLLLVRREQEKYILD